MIKALVNHYIPTHGFPRRIRSDSSLYFANKDLKKKTGKDARFIHKLGSVYHPQSQGEVERINGKSQKKKKMA